MKTLLTLLLLIPSLSWGDDNLSGKNLICGLDDLKSFVVIQFKKDRARVFTSKNANTEFWGIYDGSYKYETSLTEIITRYDRFSSGIIINRQHLIVETRFVREDEKDDRTFMDGTCTVVDLETSINSIKKQKNDWKKYKTKKTKSLKEQQKI